MLIALPVLVALLFSIASISYEFSGLTLLRHREEPPVAEHAQTSPHDPASRTTEEFPESASQSLTAEGVLSLYWFSVSFISQAFSGRLFSSPNPHASLDVMAESSVDTHAFKSRQISRSRASSTSNLASEQVLRLRISQLTAG
jgi:hypothetical protein